MKLIPHFTFNGQAEEALHFYTSVFNAKVEYLSRYKDFPSEVPAGLDVKEMEKLAYSLLSFGDGNHISMCDCYEAEENSKRGGIYMDLSFTDVAELTKVFDALSAGGKVLMPLAKTSWSENFGSVADKFGICWNLVQED